MSEPKQIRFTYRADRGGYVCSEPGDNDGLYVPVPADSDVAIDENFLLSLGFTSGHSWPNKFTYMEFDNGPSTITVCEPVDGTEEWCVGGERIPHDLMPETRGDARYLFLKLGITLKEQTP